LKYKEVISENGLDQLGLITDKTAEILENLGAIEKIDEK